MVIKHISLAHAGGFYFYRLHNQKIDTLCKKFIHLKEYLNYVFDNCPNDYFQNGPRSSALKFKVNPNIIEIQGHEISSLAKYGLENNERYNTAHSKVQVFMLENDKSTIGVEVPIWLEPDEISNFKELFKEELPLTGHIDVLRVDNNKIWIWDYKPNAHKEEYAVTQVYFYALMLSKRTGIPLKDFRCGYFDDKYAFVFRPEEIKLDKSEKLIC